MIIINKEILEFSDKELEALNLVSKICTGLIYEASDPNLRDLAEEIYSNLSDLQEWYEYGE